MIMTAFNFITNFLIKSNIFLIKKSDGFCYCCNNSYLDFIENSENLCAACFFLSTKNPSLFGKLTEKRDHSAISFLNSMLVINKDCIDLIVSDNYAKKIPQSKWINVSTQRIDDYIIELLDSPRECIVIKPTIKLEEYARYLMISDEKVISICSSKGVLHISIETWMSLKQIAKINKTEITTALNIIKRVTEGDDLSTQDKEYVRNNKLLMSKLSEILNVHIHSKVYLIKLILRKISHGC
jgi:hypothetical protein